jgi:hypothetical protein
MAELRDILKDKNIVRRDGVQDEHDQASATTPVTINVVDGWVKYTNDGALYSDGNIEIFDTTTGHLDTSSLPLYAVLRVVLNTDVLMSNSNGYILVRAVIPDTAGDIELPTVTVKPVKNTLYPEQVSFDLYNGAKAKEFGFDFYTSVEVDSADFSNRKILITV